MVKEIRAGQGEDYIYRPGAITERKSINENGGVLSFREYSQDVDAQGLAESRLSRVLKRFHYGLAAEAATMIDFSTGVFFTSRRIAEILDLNLRTVEEALRERGIVRNPLPVVKTGDLPENQHAFYKGLVYGDFAVERINWSGHPFVFIGTEATDFNRHELLRYSFFEWGDMRRSAWRSTEHDRTRTRMYLDPETFGFLENKDKPGSTILLSKIKFPPFLLGFIAARLSTQQRRLSLPDTDLLQNIANNFENQFKYPLGRTHKPEQKNSRKLGVLIVSDLDSVLKSLADTESVRRLPFSFPVMNLIKGN